MNRATSVLSSVLEAIGETPLVRLSRLTRGIDGEIVAKLDYYNPGLSKKDRVARQMIQEAERDGDLRPGQTVVELTSGNAGTGFAIVCALTGHPFVAVMSRGNSPERARMMRALGAEVVLVDQAPGATIGEVSGADLDLVERETRRIVRERQAFRPNQFELRGNFRAHYQHTGAELIAQAGGQIQAFCDIAGTGGTFGGCAAALKEHDPAIRCYVVEPEGAAVLAGRPVTTPTHRIQGAGYARAELTQLDAHLIDGFVTVTDASARDTARRLARDEGIFAGYSSGANVAAALDLLRDPCRGQTVATIINDSGLKYLSTDLWD